MTEDEKIQRIVAEKRHDEIVALLRVIAYPAQSLMEKEKRINEIVNTETKKYKFTANEKSTD